MVDVPLAAAAHSDPYDLATFGNTHAQAAAALADRRRCYQPILQIFSHLIEHSKELEFPSQDKGIVH